MEFTDLKIKGMKFKNVYLDKDSGRFDNEAIVFDKGANELYVLTHIQECCENVWIESITGELEDLIDSPLIMAEVASQTKRDEDGFADQIFYFYKFATAKGYVTIRFVADDTPYYSTEVELKHYLVCENNKVEEIREVPIRGMIFNQIYEDSSIGKGKSDSLVFLLDSHEVLILTTKMNIGGSFIEKIEGDLDYLIGVPIIKADEVTYFIDGLYYTLFRFETVHGVVKITYSTNKGTDYIKLRHWRINPENWNIEKVRKYNFFSYFRHF